MIGTLEHRLFAQAWAISVTLHGIVVILAMLLVFQMKSLPVQDIFQWNVSLVEMVQVQSVEPGAQAAGLPEPAPQAVVRPKQPVTTTSQVVPTRKPNPGLTERQQRLVETTSIMERSPAQTPPAAVQQHQEAVAQMDATPVKEVTKFEEAQHVEPVSNPIAHDEPPSRVDTSTPVRHVSPDGDKPPMVERTESVQMAAVPKESAMSQASPEPPQPVPGTVQQAPAGRADYGWLIESVSKRLAELKRYPTSARSNGLEGKVLLRAVIRADGQLAEVTVQKSSGYEELDMAAMETIREASPLHLRHELGRAQIAITVPLVYSLAR
ncbi:MAG: energy transducer TonB [Nitrospira sp.]|nr:energy transducer TonB [Nitrospira sp.]